MPEEAPARARAPTVALARATPVTPAPAIRPPEGRRVRQARGTLLAPASARPARRAESAAAAPAKRRPRDRSASPVLRAAATEPTAWWPPIAAHSAASMGPARPTRPVV